jgi:hypothetical protein
MAHFRLRAVFCPNASLLFGHEATASGTEVSRYHVEAAIAAVHAAL